MDEHSTARSWLTGCYEDPDELVGLAWSTLYAMTRLVTSRRIMGAAALSLDRAWDIARQFLDQANARLIQPGSTHRSIALELFATPGLSSNDVPDVQLATLAIEHGLTLCSHDHGFARFGRLAWTDPLDT